MAGLSDQVLQDTALGREVLESAQLLSLSSLLALSVVLSASLFSLLFIWEEPQVLLKQRQKRHLQRLALLFRPAVLVKQIVFLFLLNDFSQVGQQVCIFYWNFDLCIDRARLRLHQILVPGLQIILTDDIVLLRFHLVFLDELRLVPIEDIFNFRSHGASR